MRPAVLAIALAVLAPSAAHAADITVYSPGIVNAPLRKLADAWTAETGNKVTFAGFNVGRIRTAVGKDDPGDVVIAPTSDFTGFALKLAPGTLHGVGRVPFGLAVKAGGAHPDISSHDKFVAVVKQAGVLAFANPASGSLTGAMVEDMLKRPEFSGVRPLPIKGMIGDAIVRGDAEYGGGAISEELMAQGAEVVGPFPDSLGLFIDVSGAVLNVATAPKEAEAFLAYVTAAEAHEVWKAGGIVQP